MNKPNPFTDPDDLPFEGDDGFDTRDFAQDVPDFDPPPVVVDERESPQEESTDPTLPDLPSARRSARSAHAGPKQSDFEALVVTVGVDPDEWLENLREVGDQLYLAKKAVSQEKAQLARLESEFGAIGNLPSIWDHTRKVLLAELAEAQRIALEERIAKEAADDGKVTTKITEAGLDTYAHAHPRYAVFIADARTARREYEEARARMDDLWNDVHHLTGVKEYLTQRIRMAEERIRFSRSLASLGS